MPVILQKNETPTVMIAVLMMVSSRLANIEVNWHSEVESQIWKIRGRWGERRSALNCGDCFPIKRCKTRAPDDTAGRDLAFPIDSKGDRGNSRFVPGLRRGRIILVTFELNRDLSMPRCDFRG